MILLMCKAFSLASDTIGTHKNILGNTAIGKAINIMTISFRDDPLNQISVFQFQMYSGANCGWRGSLSIGRLTDHKSSSWQQVELKVHIYYLPLIKSHSALGNMVYFSHTTKGFHYWHLACYVQFRFLFSKPVVNM